MTQPTAADCGAALIAECKHRMIGECLPRIEQCLGELSDDDIWLRPNAQVVSVGNLVLHLCGNVRQWIIATLGGAPDLRTRDAEFSEPGPLPREELIGRLRTTLAEVEQTLDRLDPASILEPKRVQGKGETVTTILVHVTEHFSYHTGQISLHVKLRKGIDLGYYAGRDLNAKG